MARKPPSISLALGRALKSAALRDQDQATVALAKTYAAQMDADPADSAVVVKTGPLLLAALIELGMTPRARAGVLAGSGVGGGAAGGSATRKTKLELLRERGRANGTTAVDQTPS